MGKNLIQQARGKGSSTYKAPSFRYIGRASHPGLDSGVNEGKVIDIRRCPGHTAPLVLIRYDNGNGIVIAPEGMKVGDRVSIGETADINAGNTVMLKNAPDGTLIYNIESSPGDGGKFCRASGTFAKVLTKVGNGVLVQLPSKKQKLFRSDCRASIGIVAGGGRPERPFLKAGKRHHAMRARNKLYPRSSAASMNAVDHPFGNKRSSRKSKARPAAANAPPGRKVGMLSPKRSGRKKR